MTGESALPVAAVLAAVAVRDPDIARTFYERLVGAPPDESPMPGLTQWNLGPGVLQIVVTVFTCGIGHLWGLIDGIIILTKDDAKDARGYILRPN